MFELYQILEKIHLKIDELNKKVDKSNKKIYNIKKVKSYRIIIRYVDFYQNDSEIYYDIINRKDRNKFLDSLGYTEFDPVKEYSMFTPSLLHNFIKDVWGNRKSKSPKFFLGTEFESEPIHKKVLGHNGIWWEPSTDPNDINVNKVKALNYIYSELEKL